VLESAPVKRLRERSRIEEEMDREDLDEVLHREALRGLSRLNALSFAGGILWPGIRSVAADGPVRVLDVATGAGDIPIRLFARARRAGLPVTLAGCDTSDRAVAYARERAASAAADVTFFTHDALAGAFPETADVVVCSLFLHHLSRDEAVSLLARMAAAARRRVIVADLERGRAGWLLAWTAARVFTGSTVVRYDATASVESAFTAREAREMAAEAGLAGARVERCRMFRWRLDWERDR
jgi:2-polyprenyl-3-methyl-5-hydroxy-6-metoxy-1,4-benzoquinol methylase